MPNTDSSWGRERNDLETFDGGKTWDAKDLGADLIDDEVNYRFNSVSFRGLSRVDRRETGDFVTHDGRGEDVGKSRVVAEITRHSSVNHRDWRRRSRRNGHRSRGDLFNHGRGEKLESGGGGNRGRDVK